MGIFSFLFGGGKYPTTSKYEAQLAQARADYGKFKQIASGADLKTFEELKKVTASADFKNKVEHLKNDKFSQTEEYKKEQELKALAKSSDIKGYFKFMAAGDDKKSAAALSSASYAEYQTLKKVVESASFAAKAKVKDSEEAKTLARYKQLSKDSMVKSAIKYAKSSAYANFKKVAGSDRLKKYEALSEYVKTDAFIAKKKDLENKNRFKQSAEAAQLANLEALEKNKDLKWFFAQQKAGTFVDAEKWQLTFSDEFKGSKIDDSKWTLGYLWGAKTMGMVYSLADERQKFEAANAKVSGGLDIQTRPAKVNGKVWNPEAFGFVDKQLEATSALINTGSAFRQKFGKFDFKVKASGVKAPVVACIWLSSDKNEEISVATFGKAAKGLTVGVAQKLSTVADVKVDTDYFIYSLEWTAKKLTWRVNGVEVYSTTAGVPQEEMYIGLSSHVIGDGAVGSADLMVDWAKVYAEK